MLHDFGGLRVRSAFDLPGLPALREDGLPRRRPADIHVSLTSTPTPSGRPVHQWGGRYQLALESFGDDWLIRHGAGIGVTVADAARTLRCHCPDPARLPLLAEIVVRRVLPRVSMFHGRVPIHAATLGDAHGAIMLLGSSGAGKSTMTAALATRLGWHILSDDMSVLDEAPRPMVFPTVQGVSVWPPSRDALALPPQDCRPLQNVDGKIWYVPASIARPEPRPLESVILLSMAPGDARITYQRLSGPSAAVMMFSQLVPFNPRDTGQMTALVTRWAEVMAEVPVYGLVYRRDFGLLPDVVDTIQRLRAERP